MKIMIIGSTAIKHHFPHFNRQPKDVDFAVDYKTRSTKNVEYLYNPIIFKYCDKEICTPDMLLSLKVSHVFWDINWDKHMWNVQFLLKQGCKFNTEYIKEQIEFWKKYLPTIRRSNLNQSKKEFFTNAVNDTVNQHDDLHLKLNPHPAYKKLLKEGCEVELDESKWYFLTFEEKCDVVYEETAVMAYERYKGMYYKKAYNRQLKDNIMKHFPFYIALFAIENYILLSNPQKDYYEYFN